MTLSSVIEAAWDAAIWTHADILAITDRIHKFQVTTDSEYEVSRLYFEEKINFFEVFTGRYQNYLQTSSTVGRTIQYHYIVEVNYYKEVGTDGSHFTDVRDAFETLFGLVVSELGDTWSSTVDIWNPDNAIPTIAETTISNKKCWKGTYRFFAEKLTEL